VVAVRERSRSMNAIQEAMEARQDASQFTWLDIDTKSMQGTYTEVPTREQIPVDIDERLIVEFYSK
jgi:small subunit ribosomal protein S4